MGSTIFALGLKSSEQTHSTNTCTTAGCSTTTIRTENLTFAMSGQAIETKLRQTCSMHLRRMNGKSRIVSRQACGFRWDHNRQGNTLGIWQSNDQVAPRIGFIWNLDRNNQTVIKAHYGHYFEGCCFMPVGLVALAVNRSEITTGNITTKEIGIPPAADLHLKTPTYRTV